MTEEYIKKLEEENKALVAKLDTVRELENTILCWEKLGSQNRREIERLMNQNNTQARMIAQLQERLGMVIYMPLKFNGNEYKTKIMEDYVKRKLCELPDPVFISDMVDPKEIKNYKKTVGYDDGI
jgi:predicted RNase H-like nuclease (RuvC/YqgF family)